MARQLALFGGTFDPVHFGHLITARAVREQCGFERITLVPAGSSPHKESPQAAGSHRLAMLELAVGGDPVFDISRVDLDRTGPSYTFDTLTALRREHGADVELRWIIGADMLEGLSAWRRAGEVLGMVQIIVAARPPWWERIPAILADLRGQFDPEQVRRVEESMASTPLIDIASSTVRRRVAEGRSVRYLVPESVRSYIEEHGLYR